MKNSSPNLQAFDAKLRHLLDLKEKSSQDAQEIRQGSLSVRDSLQKLEQYQQMFSDVFKSIKEIASRATPVELQFMYSALKKCLPS